MPRVRVQIIERYRPFYLEVWCSDCGRIVVDRGYDGSGIVATTSVAICRRAMRAHRAEHRGGPTRGGGGR